ncbi:MAG: penicillin-binding transpeptidase domain-containing protein, partial [Oscillospiraceae bacterium]
SGIEFAFDEELKNAQDKIFVCCKTNARGALQVGEIPYLSSKQGTGQDVVLTIDDTIQRLCEAQAQQKMEKGSIVVIDVKTGRIKTSVSVPSFDPTNINKSIENGDTSLINRATCEFNVGSIFKPLLAAVALENGIDEKETYTCKGYIEVGDHIYRCANFVGHGEVDLKKALEVSCNCYFVDLGQKLGGDAIFDFANMVGFGKETQLGGGYQSKNGNL